MVAPPDDLSHVLPTSATSPGHGCRDCMHKPVCHAPGMLRTEGYVLENLGERVSIDDMPVLGATLLSTLFGSHALSVHQQHGVFLTFDRFRFHPTVKAVHALICRIDKVDDTTLAQLDHDIGLARDVAAAKALSRTMVRVGTAPDAVARQGFLAQGLSPEGLNDVEAVASIAIVADTIDALDRAEYDQSECHHRMTAAFSYMSC